MSRVNGHRGRMRKVGAQNMQPVYGGQEAR